MRQRPVMPFGAEASERGVHFALWAPNAEGVTLLVDGREHPMPDHGDGWRRLDLGDARVGSDYAFRIGELTVPDPASRAQPGPLTGPSRVVDPTSYRWTDAAWRGRPWEEAVLYEVHVGTATESGTFAALAERLPDLAALGVTVIELMPLAAFSGTRNWGYDGVLPFAPEATYGTPDDLRALIDRAHGLGLSVLLDVVYNHFGPVGNYLNAYAKSFFTDRHKTPWGSGLNFDGGDGRPVRDYFVENAMYWLREYHLDGLRLDAVHAILDDSDPHILEELARRVRDAFPERHVHLILENERNEARWLERDGAGTPVLHTAQWNDDIHHCWHTLLTGEADAYYEDYADRPVERLARCLAEGFAYQGEPSRHAGGKARGERSAHLTPSAFIGFLQNHDQVGNRALGERLSDLVPEDRLALARGCLLLAPPIPMLFMGEEWSASTPFQFFVDFSDDPALQDAVREGRRREFASFAAFGNIDAVPDPTDEATFLRSRLDWGERTRAPHAAVLADTRRLLGLRRDVIVPITRGRYRGARTRPIGDGALDVAWSYDGGTVRLVANLGTGEVETTSEEAGETIWAHGDARAAEGVLRMPPWSAIVAVGEGS